jgi:hypothetical protein
MRFLDYIFGEVGYRGAATAMPTPVTVVKLALLKMAASWLGDTVTVARITLLVLDLIASITTTLSVVLLLMTLTA